MKAKKEFSQHKFEAKLVAELCGRIGGYDTLVNAALARARRKLEALGYARRLARDIVQGCYDVAVLIDEAEGGAKDRRDAEYAAYAAEWQRGMR